MLEDDDYFSYREFITDLERCATEEERFRLCEGKAAELTEDIDRVKILCLVYATGMSERSITVKKKSEKAEKAKKAKKAGKGMYAEENADFWDEFFGNARQGEKASVKHLLIVSALWPEVASHYGFASRSTSYKRDLSKAVMKVPK